jgi:hypothetical protein
MYAAIERNERKKCLMRFGESKMFRATQPDASRMSAKRVSRRAAVAPMPWLSHI